MNNDEKAMLVSLVFLMICCYTLLAFQDIGLDTDLPLTGHIQFSVKENIQYFLPATLFLAFIVFWKIRKEKEVSESSTQFE